MPAAPNGCGVAPSCSYQQAATAPDGSEKRFEVLARIDTPEELSYYKHGGILPYVLRSLVGKKS